MDILVITPPAPIVSLAEAKAHLRVTADGEDALISSYIAAASAHIDGPDGILKRAVMTQTLALITHAPPRRVRLLGPVASLEAVTWTDETGDPQTVDEDSYFLSGDYLSLTARRAWPWSCPTNPVRVEFKAGADEAPLPIRQAVLLLVGQWFRNRMAINVGNIVNEMPNGVKALLAPHKDWRV